MIVCKFGGSSLCDERMIRRVLDIINSNDERRFIVLSAPGKRDRYDAKITDMLYKAFENRHDAQYIFSQIAHRYTEICASLCPDFDICGALNEIRENLHHSRDYAASRGEYLCTRLFSEFSNIPFVDAADLIQFYPDGTLNFQRTRECTRARLSVLDRAVIPGFYGSMPDGSIHTFARGGSDVSGAIVAAAMDADLYENWTDVDGLFSADPGLIPHARRNPHVSLSQMHAIAEAGANLLHPDSLAILKGTGTDTVIKNTFSPKATGTRISEGFKGIVPCITGRRDVPCPVLAKHCKACEDERHMCVISAFGLDSTAMRRIQRRLKHVCIIHMHDHFKIITQNELYETAVSELHKLLHE